MNADIHVWIDRNGMWWARVDIRGERHVLGPHETLEPLWGNLGPWLADRARPKPHKCAINQGPIYLDKVYECVWGECADCGNPVVMGLPLGRMLPPRNQ